MRTDKTGLIFNLDSLLATLFIVSCVIPYVSYIGRGDIISYTIFILWLASVILRKGQFDKILNSLATRKAELMLLFLFFLVALFNYFFITTTGRAFQFTLMPVTYFLLVVMDSYYFRRNPRYKFTIFFAVIIVLALQAAISIPYVIHAEDLVSRMYTSGELEGVQLVDALKHGVGSANLYSFLCGVFFLGIGMLNKFDKTIRSIAIICLALILFSILASSYSVAFWMLSIGGLIFLLRSNWRKLKVKYTFIIGILCTGLVVLYNSFLANSRVVEPIERKIRLIKSGNLKEDGRMDLAANSMKTFVNHPFFGAGVPEWGDEKTIGSHLPWIDFLAQYGFFGFLPFLLFLVILVKKNYRFYLNSPKKNVYATSCLIGVSIFILTNFIDPVIFEASTITMLIFFYTSMDNWAPAVLAKQAVHEENSLHQ